MLPSATKPLSHSAERTACYSPCRRSSEHRGCRRAVCNNGENRWWFESGMRDSRTVQGGSVLAAGRIVGSPSPHTGTGHPRIHVASHTSLSHTTRVSSKRTRTSGECDSYVPTHWRTQAAQGNACRTSSQRHDDVVRLHTIALHVHDARQTTQYSPHRKTQTVSDERQSARHTAATHSAATKLCCSARPPCTSVCLRHME